MYINWIRPIGLVVFSCALFACTTQVPQPGAHYQATSLNNARKANACPSGKVQVCDRRKAIGCKCQSMQHMRAFIRG